MDATRDKENWKGIDKNALPLGAKDAYHDGVLPLKTQATVLPTLYLSNFREPLFLNFRNVAVNSSRAISFAMEVDVHHSQPQSRRVVQVDRVPKHVQVTVAEKSGVVMWSPIEVGPMREVILLSLNGRHRLQITIHGHAVAGSNTFTTKDTTRSRTALMPTIGNSNARGGEGRGGVHESPFACQPRRLMLETGKEGGGGHLRPQNHGNSDLSATFHDLENRLEAVLSARRQEGPGRGGGRGRGEESSFFFPSGLDDDHDHEDLLQQQPRKSLSVPSSPRGRSMARVTEDSRGERSSSVGLTFERSSRSSNSTAVKKMRSQRRDPIASFRQERVLTEWLNFVLCPPTPAQSLPHPGEFLKSQTDEARAQVQELYDSEMVVQARQAVTREIARKRLQVRDDKDMYADLNLREAFIKLLLSYQLPWLQVGLEVVFGMEITKARVKKGRDGQLVRVPTIGVLRTLIVQHILSNPDVNKSYANRPAHRYRDAFQHELRANTMQRFLEIVLLLDRAKALEILPRNRPLFRPSASVKSSAEILLVFAKEYLAGEGNFLRHLAGLGYTVQHQQHYLDEFDFRITSLCRDLRDGVRLARLVDLLEDKGQDKSLVCDLLRVPAVSRLQKVHNVKVALEGLGRRGVPGLKRPALSRERAAAGGGGPIIGPDDIVDGHREKTVVMLWEVIRHYNLDYLVSSLTGITHLQSLVRGRIMRRRFLRLRGLALNLQRLYRCHRLLFHCRAFPVPVVCTLKSHWRRHQAIRAYHRTKQSIILLQAQARKTQARHRFLSLKTMVIRLQQLRRQAVAVRHLYQVHAATSIAKVFKGHMARKLAVRKLCSIIKLQAMWRMVQAKQRAHQRLQSIVTVQAAVRGSLLRKQLVRSTASITVLQAHLRRRLAQRHWRFVLTRVILVQTCWRRHAAKQQYSHLKASTIKVQAWTRSRMAHHRWTQLRKAILRLQRSLRKYRFQQEMAAVRLQAHVRCFLARQQYRQVKAAALVLQRIWRGRFARLAFQSSTYAILLIQKYTRRFLAQQSFRSSLVAVQKLQAVARGSAVRRSVAKMHLAAVVIQKVERGRHARQEWKKAQQAVRVIQAVVRGYIGRREAKNRWQAMVRIQKGWHQMFMWRMYKEQVYAAVSIQAAWRGKCVRTSVEQMRGRVIKVQACFRGYQGRQMAAQRRTAIAKIQKVWRQMCMWRRYKESMKAAACIQAAWRGKCVRTSLDTIRNGAIKMQLCFRGYQGRQAAMERRGAAAKIRKVWRQMYKWRRYKEQVKAAACIQAAWRGKCIRTSLDQMRNEVIKMQVRFRGYQGRQMAARRRTAIAKIQKVWLQMYMWRRYKEQVEAAACIQAAWRGKCVRKSLEQTQNRAIKLQACFRGYQGRQVAKQRRRAVGKLQQAGLAYIEKQRRRRTAMATSMQSLWRSYSTRRLLHRKVMAVIKVQSAWRGHSTYLVYQQKRWAAIQLQWYVRGWQARAHLRKAGLAALGVQRLWKGHQTRMMLHQAHQAALELQRIWRGTHARGLFLKAKNGVINVQALLRRKRATRQYQRVLKAIIKLQQIVRLRRLERAMQAYREVVILAQSRWRGLLARRRMIKAKAAATYLQAFARLIIVRRRTRNFRRAIKKAQAIVRGWLVRKTNGPRLRKLRIRVKEATIRAIQDPSLQIGARHSAALDVLMNSKSCAHILKCCMTLEISTSLSRVCCEALVAVDGVPKILSVIRSCNRSKPHMELLRHVLRVLQNVTAYDFLLPSIAEASGAVETLVELLQQYRPDDNTFMPAASLLLNACQYGALAKVDLMHPNVQRRLQGSLRLLERKAETERNSKSTRYHKAADKEISVMAIIRVMRRVVALGHHHQDD